MSDQDCFVKVTNKDIYKKLIDIEKCTGKNKSRIKVNTWISSTALTLVVGLMIGISIR